MKKVCIYCRVNSPEQVNVGNGGLEEQRAMCQLIAEIHNYEATAKMRSTIGYRVKKMNPGKSLDELIIRSREEGSGTVMIHSRKSFANDVKKAKDIQEIIRKYGLDVVCADELKSEK